MIASGRLGSGPTGVRIDSKPVVWQAWRGNSPGWVDTNLRGSVVIAGPPAEVEKADALDSCAAVSAICAWEFSLTRTKPKCTEFTNAAEATCLSVIVTNWFRV